MNEKKNGKNYLEQFQQKVLIKEDRKIKAKNSREAFYWSGIVGMVGWSVTLPLIGGLALGIWLDGHFPGRFSYTLMFMLGGLVLGCALAWHWVRVSGLNSGKKQK